MTKFDEETYATSGICTGFDTAKPLAGHAIEALNHKDLNGGSEHLNLIVQEIEISGNSTSNLTYRTICVVHGVVKHTHRLI